MLKSSSPRRRPLLYHKQLTIHKLQQRQMLLILLLLRTQSLLNKLLHHNKWLTSLNLNSKLIINHHIWCNNFLHSSFHLFNSKWCNNTQSAFKDQMECLHKPFNMHRLSNFNKIHKWCIRCNPTIHLDTCLYLFITICLWTCHLLWICLFLCLTIIWTWALISNKIRWK